MNVNKISPKELYEKMKKDNPVFLLDVRASEKFDADHIEGTTRNIPKNIIFEMDEKSAQAVELPKDEEIVVTCTTGNSAAKCAAILAEKDYNVLVLEGGVTAWKEYVKSL
ncbi:rhodanese-like domain-containing protein [Bacillus sp. CGMCC 1.16607]|uniref:rhodanese-like domain-containing protein n=1 Tax=Bacillus sp. CGMCC 1.16607 TaxID=3351842 RepID=UPI00362586F8